jgi:hypothetical protein
MESTQIGPVSILVVTPTYLLKLTAVKKYDIFFNKGYEGKTTPEYSKSLYIGYRSIPFRALTPR